MRMRHKNEGTFRGWEGVTPVTTVVYGEGKTELKWTK